MKMIGVSQSRFQHGKNNANRLLVIHVMSSLTAILVMMLVESASADREIQLTPLECIEEFGEILDNCLSGQGCCTIVAAGGLSVGAIVGISIGVCCGCICCSSLAVAAGSD